MRTKIILATAIAAIGLALGAQAQNITNVSNGGTVTFTNVPAGEGDFLTTAAQWLTTENPALSFTNASIFVSTGARWNNNLQWANYLKAEKDFGSFLIDGMMNNQGIAGVIRSVEGGGGYIFYNKYDLRMNVSLNGGYDFQQHSIIIDPELWIQKLFARNSGAEIGTGYMAFLKGPKNQYPGIDVAFFATF